MQQQPPDFAALARRFDGPGVRAVALMGSHARGDAGPFSDVDLMRLVAADSDVPGAGSHLIDGNLVVVSNVPPDALERWFTDPVEALRYQHHVEHVFPNFSVKNCEACHNPGTYVEPPDSSQSLAGILSGSDKVADRNIGTIKSYVTGPGARACGACHRSHMINEDKAGKLEAFYRHLKSNGYLVEDGTGVLDKVIETIMGKFQSAP